MKVVRKVNRTPSHVHGNMMGMIGKPTKQSFGHIFPYVWYLIHMLSYHFPMFHCASLFRIILPLAACLGL